MSGSRSERLAPLSGVVWVALFILGAAIMGMYDYLPPADRVADVLEANSRRVMFGGYLGALSTFFLIWFAGSLRSALREREGPPGRLSGVAFGGGVAVGVALAAGFAVLTIAAERARTAGGITDAGAVTMYDLWSAITGLVVPVGLAVVTGAGGVVALQRAIFPVWFRWASILVALGCLSPVGYLVQILALAWVVVVSVWLYGRGGAAP